MKTARTTKCSTCAAEIVWTVTAKGKRMPVDAESVDHDALAWNGGAPVFDAGRHRSHFATCAHAAQHRRTRS